MTAQSFLQTPEQFKAIILRSQPDGSVVHLSDVARVELGGENYTASRRVSTVKAAAGIAVKLAPGANALQTADAVKKRATELSASLPTGLSMGFPVDNTQFVRLSIKDVVFTLLEAIGLVIVVMFVFLQNWRVTLIPALAVPVVLLGTFGVLAAFGYSINTLTMFAMVLAIGLLVDDAIVVVENVERIMEEEGLSPREATLKSMDEITGALVGIGLVLSAVFLPMAFLGGSTGRDLPPVLGHRRLGGGALGHRRPDPHARVVRHPAEAASTNKGPSRRPLLRLVQPLVRRLREALFHGRSVRPDHRASRGRCMVFLRHRGGRDGVAVFYLRLPSSLPAGRGPGIHGRPDQPSGGSA